MAKQIVYPVKLTEEEYEAIKNIIERYNRVSTLKIDNIHEFLKLAIRFYIRELESIVVYMEAKKDAKS